MKAGPIGLGYLAVTGFIADTRTFWCPSSGGAGLQPGNCDQPRTNKAYHHVTTPLDILKTLGPFNGLSLTNGDWTKVHDNNPYWYSGSYQKAVMGQYAYRSVPSFNYENPRATSWNVQYVRPYVPFSPGLPWFRTEKLLAGRCIATDSFAKNGRLNAPNQPLAGDGMDVHRDGYNALYGDGHVAWFGDPQQRIIWWPQTGAYWYCGLAYTGTRGSGHNDDRTQNQMVWRLFDQAAGMDAATTYSY